ncbi:MAG TPA: ABC transporter substrate-binding protein, partial [Sporichthyaceae bacterium]
MTKTWRRVPAILTAGLLLLSACGTRASDAEIAAEAGGSPSSLSPAVLKQISDAAAAGAASAVGSAGVPAPAAGAAAAAPAAAAGGTAPAAGATTGTAATTPAAGAAAATTTKAGAKKNTVTTQSAAAPAAAAASGPAACTKPGDPVAIGQVGTFSGVTGPAWTGGRTALAVWVKDINARGGLACHPVEVHSADDGGDPAKAAAEVQELVT